MEIVLQKDTPGSISLYKPAERGRRILWEVFELHREELDTDKGFSVEAPEATTVKCPRCESEVPTSIYCVACGCPLEMEVSSDEGPRSEKLRFDLTPLKEMQADVEPQGDGREARPLYAEADSTFQEMDYPPEPEGESLILTHAAGGASMDQADIGESDAPETVSHEGPEPQIEASSTEAIEDTDPVIEELANELLNSAYLELWSIGLLRKDETGEDQFLRNFESYQGRLERCVTQREHLLTQIRDIEAVEARGREARVQLDELDVRRSLGDLREGEYEAMAPALRWTIDHHEAEMEMRRRRTSLLENPMSLMPTEKVREAAAMAEEAMKLVREAEASAKLSTGTAASVRASIETIEELLERTH